MRIAAHRGTRLHAPENTREALISGYTGGADVLEFDLQLTKDGSLILSHDGTTDRLTGVSGLIIEKTLDELKTLDFSRTYQPRESPSFKYFHSDKRKLKCESFPNVLEYLPADVELLIELKHDSSIDTGRRDEFVSLAIEAISAYGVEDRVVLYSKDSENLKAVKLKNPTIRVAAFDFQLKPVEQLELLKETGADGLVTSLENILDSNYELTEFGTNLEKYCHQQKLRVGAILYPSRTPGVFSKEEWEALSNRKFVWSVSTDSMIDVAFVRKNILLCDEAFEGTKVNRERFALGYAKANSYGLVEQDNGVHIRISKYPNFPNEPTDPIEKRLTDIETKLTYTAKDWPYYSGGGLGFTPGVSGPFSAEVDYSVENVGQATTLEMAVLNVDPGAHQATPPKSFKDKDSFYDPHGAPPYVGVEHDEDDGYRINWNLGTDYDNNQYGPPVGNGKTPRSARLRLERRGSYFSAYYRNEVDARDWVCCGVVRNQSLNNVLYLRCVGKRWRQENEDKPSEFMPVIPNHFTFKNLTIRRYL